MGREVEYLAEIPRGAQSMVSGNILCVAHPLAAPALIDLRDGRDAVKAQLDAFAQAVEEGFARYAP